MCHNVIDGRYHTVCGHFIGMHSEVHDCLRPNCLFSRRHLHSVGSCKSQSCIRLMALPVKNPIRISPTNCCDCIVIERAGAAAARS
ncbi:hypothetical protein F5J12DRAFT_805005 [Pisolithus orientalis]|uniref:uncharacterized protein n=1 Tax=Pisolithus orientalis TaxID=936130 RepID=UPI002225787D|nr:uncharacterized protein F5J12DRAFT_805005 [Pisolithus orientalis]KAI6028379.1 hypothetical protein F5J12DRAFT_805005 [Pisolithus orientalis]KAI6150788.1 hypothetical protein BKA82DRAFT_4119763 [Pisolithus tinctorius]